MRRVCSAGCSANTRRQRACYSARLRWKRLSSKPSDGKRSLSRRRGQWLPLAASLRSDNSETHRKQELRYQRTVAIANGRHDNARASFRRQRCAGTVDRCRASGLELGAARRPVARRDAWRRQWPGMKHSFIRIAVPNHLHTLYTSEAQSLRSGRLRQ